MKSFLRNVCIYVVTLFGFSALYAWWVRRKHGALVRVLVFHDIQDELWFRRVIDTLTREYHILSPEEFSNKQFDTTCINLLMTFDDGYASWGGVVAPLLEEMGIRAVFFVNGKILETTTVATQREFVEQNLLLHSEHALMTSGDLDMLHMRGHLIGGHTWSHKRLSLCTVPEQENEIERDREIIFRYQGGSKMFAYPFGLRSDFTQETQTLVARAGYDMAFSTEPGFVTFENRYALPRVCIPDGLSPRACRQWVLGGYDIYNFMKRLCVR